MVSMQLKVNTCFFLLGDMTAAQPKGGQEESFVVEFCCGWCVGCCWLILLKKVPRDGKLQKSFSAC